MDEQTMNMENEPKGCLDEFIMLLFGIGLVCFLVMTSGCKTQPMPTPQRDSVRVEFRHDSIYVWQHDSVFRDRWRSGDTIYVTMTKWQTRWKERTLEVHDTIRTNEVQVVTQKYVPNYYKNTSAGFWVLLAVLIAIVGWKIAKIYFKINSGGIL